MFPDSEIAKKFACGKDKTGYIVRFGLAPYFKEQLVNSINKAGPFVLMFDESLNQATKKKQMDVHIRYWDDGCVRARYLGSQFLGHGRAEDLLHHIKECGAQLKMRQLISVSMDGPNVNFKLVNLLQKEHAELYGGAQLVLVGSCGLHTLHNARVVEIWPMLQKYVDGVKNKKIPNPATASYDTIAAAQRDPLIIAKLQFFFAISRTFSPFLLKFQTDEPVMPFLAKDLAELLKNWVSPMNADIGLGAESVIKALQSKPGSRVVVRHIACLDPTNMSRDPEWCIGKMKSVVQRFLQDKQLAGGVSAGDVIVQQFERFLSVEGRGEGFLSFQPFEQRLDVFLHEVLSTYPELRRFCQSLLLLSHGQATVERGFSVNKEVETVNLLEESLEAQRLICDQVSVCGGVLKVPLTKELLASAAFARSRYRIYLDQQQKKRQSATQSLKRRAVEDELEQLKKKRKILEEVCGVLQKDADQLAEQAEGKAGSLMAQLLTKSNTLRRRHKEKRIELEQTEKEWDSKANELRHMP
ncbi:Zinc finger MYM-type protein 1 [Dissostichus eleginoides]|uniref:Zinc finger MYM-type protein 1 n=1 Tax=Dissostichus eleginoides TaxID=100907 RepID=A0AAD9F292_DISEL|nr:Zinc finger MYM-type protein 1 [Dissostichus eleginoides]